MSTIVIMPGGFHPFHAGHAALYNSARRAFPDAEVYVAATNDTSTRPFPFAIKEKLAKLAGVEPGHFVQVKSPFQTKEITQNYDPERDVVIFVRSEKDANKPPQAGGVKKDGSPTYLQPLLGAKRLEPFGKHAYMAYLPTVEFGPGMTSATEIRTAWPQLDDRRKTALVMSLYPRTQGNPALAGNVVKMLDTAMNAESLEEEVRAAGSGHGAGMTATWQRRYNQPPMEGQGFAATLEEDPDYIEEKWSQKYKRSINCANPRGFSQRAHCAGRRKNEDVAEGKIKLSTDPNWYGAEVGDYKASGPIVNIPTNRLVGFEPDDKMNQPASKANVEKIVDGLKQGAKLPPLLVRQYKNGYQVLDGHHRFWAYKLLGVKSIPAQVVPAEDIEEITKQGVAEAQLAEKCWDTHRQAGMKKKGNRMVPNCVPKESK